MNQQTSGPNARVSVVTPTLRRPGEVRAFVANLCTQQHLPAELIVVDGAPPNVGETEAVVRACAQDAPFPVRYLRRGGGTAVQRNVGVEYATGDYVAFFDDDVRFAPDFLARAVDLLARPEHADVAAVAGYVVNEHLDPARSRRWRWYRRLRLFSTFEPGRFDWRTGYPINRNLQPPHDGVREIDCMGAHCAVWRRAPFDAGLRFAPFFAGFGVAEDAHLAMQARARGWRILECGAARCTHERSPRGRESAREVQHKTAVNYRYLFVSVAPRRSPSQELRFWTVQAVDVVRVAAAALRTPGGAGWPALLGKLSGVAAATRLRPGAGTPP